MNFEKGVKFTLPRLQHCSVRMAECIRFGIMENVVTKRINTSCG